MENLGVVISPEGFEPRSKTEKMSEISVLIQVDSFQVDTKGITFPKMTFF